MLPQTRRAKATSRRRLDNKGVTGAHFYTVTARELINVTIHALNPVAPTLPIATTRDTPRRSDTAAAKDGGSHWFEANNSPERAISTSPLSSAATTATDAERFESHRKSPFQHFRIRQTRVGHVRVHSCFAIEAWTCWCAGTDRFIILMMLVAKSKIVLRMNSRQRHLRI